ncbi:MAG: response regulator transcription factor [Clostridia bacterium]|nr:response regulator transcription factor [Clostridia bacterium]
MINVLVVEDNQDIREMFCQALSDNGYNTFPAEDGLKAFDVLEKQIIDIALVDIMMPNMDGYEFTKHLRREGETIPVLMITAKDDYDSLQKGFLTGADDYMVKPVNIKEMLIRVSALLRRAKINSEKKVTIGSTVLDYESMTVSSNGQDMVLPLKEFNLLFKLLSYPNKIFTRQQIMDGIWGMDSDTDDRTINTHINRLREKFASNPDFEIITIRGLGYKAVKK